MGGIFSAFSLDCCVNGSMYPHLCDENARLAGVAVAAGWNARVGIPRVAAAADGNNDDGGGDGLGVVGANVQRE